MSRAARGTPSAVPHRARRGGGAGAPAGAQPGRAGARIAPRPRPSPGVERPAGQQAEARRRHVALAADGASRRRASPTASARKRLTMRSSSEWKATTTSRPPVASRRSAAARPRGELVELVVDEDAQRLEGAGRRIDASALAGGRRRARRSRRARRCGDRRAPRAAATMARGDAARPLLLAKDGDEAGELRRAPAR